MRTCVLSILDVNDKHAVLLNYLKNMFESKIVCTLGDSGFFKDF